MWIAAEGEECEGNGAKHKKEEHHRKVNDIDHRFSKRVNDEAYSAIQ
jgi:hypothetical protein